MVVELHLPSVVMFFSGEPLGLRNRNDIPGIYLLVAAKGS